VTDREVWIVAGVILAEHGEMTPDYIIDQLGEVLDSDVAAVDAITGAALQ
jgi:hypothetical protein